MQIEVILAAAAAVNRFVEAAKTAAVEAGLPKEYQKLSALVLALVCGVLVAELGDLNLFEDVRELNNFGGHLGTGFVIGLGADWIHVFTDLFYSWRDVRRGSAKSPQANAIG